MKRNRFTVAALALALVATAGVSAYAVTPTLAAPLSLELGEAFEITEIAEEALVIGENVIKFDISEVTPLPLELGKAFEITEIAEDALVIGENVIKLDISEVTPISLEFGELPDILKNVQFLRRITVEK